MIQLNDSFTVTTSLRTATLLRLSDTLSAGTTLFGRVSVDMSFRGRVLNAGTN